MDPSFPSKLTHFTALGLQRVRAWPERAWRTAKNAAAARGAQAGEWVWQKIEGRQARHEKMWSEASEAILRKDCARMSQLLAQHGQRLASSRPRPGESSLLNKACRQGDIGMIDLLLRTGRRYDSWEKISALTEALVEGHLDCAQWLLGRGFKLVASGGAEMSHMSWAAACAKSPATIEWVEERSKMPEVERVAGLEMLARQGAWRVLSHFLSLPRWRRAAVESAPGLMEAAYASASLPTVNAVSFLLPLVGPMDRARAARAMASERRREENPLDQEERVEALGRLGLFETADGREPSCVDAQVLIAAAVRQGFHKVCRWLIHGLAGGAVHLDPKIIEFAIANDDVEMFEILAPVSGPLAPGSKRWAQACEGSRNGACFEGLLREGVDFGHDPDLEVLGPLESAVMNQKAEIAEKILAAFPVDDKRARQVIDRIEMLVEPQRSNACERLKGLLVSAVSRHAIGEAALPASKSIPSKRL